MTQRINPLTSILAHESVKPSKNNMYAKIIVGMEKLRVGGNFEEIAMASNMEPAQVHKRLPEMQGLGIVFNVGITHLTSKGRASMVRQLTSLSKSNLEPKIALKQGELEFNTVTNSWDDAIE